MPAETVGEAAHLFTVAHPPRSDSPEYKRSRKTLMASTRGCFVCGGPPDMTHPEFAGLPPAELKGLEDHHGGGLTYKGILYGLNLFGLEWSLGWAASAKVIAKAVTALNVVQAALGEPTYDLPIVDTPSVMAWVDSTRNANVALCKPHHVGTQHQHTPDVNGHEAVGIHEISLPIWLGQVTCEWDRWDMWLGTTGTVAVAAPRADGSVLVLDASKTAHPDLARGALLDAAHPLVKAAA